MSKEIDKLINDKIILEMESSLGQSAEVIRFIIEEALKNMQIRQILLWGTIFKADSQHQILAVPDKVWIWIYRLTSMNSRRDHFFDREVPLKFAHCQRVDLPG